MGDNRNYIWDNDHISARPEYSYIENWITEKAKVIDLGCGNGSLLQILRNNKDISASGIEISATGVDICKKRGLQVSPGRIDVDLRQIPANSFDFAVCNVTIQMVMNPEVVLQEMKRIARCQIISFPNFAFLWQRLDLLFAGQMPRRLLYGYDWYNTGHIHQLSIKDFKRTASALGLIIRDKVYLVGRRKMLFPFWPNMLATEAIFLLGKSR
ncbi:MAG: methyltransferase domain-containing protein [Elusimicrobia bacterium]|nr:methyltransferase domain-containing protein [Elusimicrobiota bacterium]